MQRVYIMMDISDLETISRRMLIGDSILLEMDCYKNGIDLYEIFV